MKGHCWRNPRLEAEKERDKVWPELQCENHQRRKNDQMRVNQHPKNSASNVFGNKSASLNSYEYPELGGKMSKRKNDLASIFNENIIGDEAPKIKTKKYLKRSRRSNLIRINIQEALENQRILKNTLAEKKIKCCDRVVEAKRNKIFLSKVKRPSKLKQIIINERKKQKEMRHREARIQPIVDVSEIKIEELKIEADPEVDFDYVRSLSTLNFFGNEFRDSKSDSLPDKILENRKDVTRRLENLLISASESDVNLVEDDLRHDISNLEIEELDFQAGIHLGDINRALSLRNEVVENPAIQNFQEKNEIRYSKKFREYCTNITSAALNEKLEKFLIELFRLQKRLYERDSVKGRYKRRYYTGFKEVEKHVNLKKTKFVIIVPDLEKVEVEGGLDDAVEKLIASCRKQDIPICFGLTRRKLGYLTHRKGCVSCIGISNFGGAEEKFEAVLKNLVEAKNEFRKLKEDKLVDVGKLIVQDLLISERINLTLKMLASTT